MIPDEVMTTILRVLDCTREQITDITPSKKGMTNRSFIFAVDGVRYLVRIPGEGTGKLIDRYHEHATYQAIEPHNLCDDVLFLDPQAGYKITRYLEGSRVCDPTDDGDVEACMRRLRQFHDLQLSVEHTFDLFGEIEHYESLWDGTASVYDDYAQTKAAVMALKGYIDAHACEQTLAHIDAVPDNFLFCDGQIRLIDWEYAGMHDPHIDVAMFAIYALYDRSRIEALIDTYFVEGCLSATRLKIYCYIAVCGLLWSNWCEFKRQLGVDFGDYARDQYRYAKEYVKVFQTEQNKRRKD